MLRSSQAGNPEVQKQRETPRILASLIEGVPGEVLHRQPAPGKWSICAILAHMAEDELVSSWRYRQMIESSGALLAGFDQDEWARLGDYQSWDPRSALEMFNLLRQANLQLFDRLTPEEWQRCGIHAERGRMTVAELANHMAGHDESHIRQIHRILSHNDVGL